MNIFRIMGDLCHYTAIITIFAKIIASKSCMGISGRYREVHFFVLKTAALRYFVMIVCRKKIVTYICRQTFSSGHRFSSSSSSSRGTWTCSPTSSRCTTPRSRSSSSSLPRPTSTWSLSNTQGQSHQIWTHSGTC